MASEECVSLSPEQLLEDGKKQLAAGNAIEAVESFQEACGILVEKHGQLACELAEPYYLYGRALLELARSQNTVLGSGIPVPEEKEDSSDEEETEENGEAPETDEATIANGESTGEAADEDTVTSSDDPGPSVASGETPSLNEDAPGSSSAGPSSSTANEDAPGSSSAGPSSSTAAPDANEMEEDESDLKLAWEILELARVICQKQSSEEYQLKLADVQLALAEVSSECDQTDQAIADLNSSLQIRQLLLDPHDRRVAEAHFSLGLTHSLCNQPDEAIKHFNSSKDVLLKKKELLDKELSQQDLPEETRKSIEEEVSEISSLIPDLESKVSDTREMKRLAEEREKQAVEQECGFPQQTTAQDKKPVTDISHLVRKRAPDSVDGSQAKRAHTGNGSITAEQ